MKCDEREQTRQTLFQPESPYVIVCEGFQDIGLVCALVKHLNITNCDVTYPKKIDGGNGKDAICKLVALLANGAEQVEGLLVIADADNDPDKAFNDICRGLDKYPIPKSAFSITRKNHLRSGVFLLPGKGKTGALEHLLLEVFAGERPDLINCVDTYRACTQGTKAWAANDIAKMKMQCLVAATCSENPYCSLAWVWSKKSIPLKIDSPALKELAEFIIEFSK